MIYIKTFESTNLTNKFFDFVKKGNIYGIKKVLNIGFDINETNNKDGQTALTYTVKDINNINNLEVLKFLIDNGADLNKKNLLGYTPLINSIRYNNTNASEFLIDSDCDVNLTNNNGDNALMVSAYYSSSSSSSSNELFKILLEKTKDINYTNSDNESALIQASISNNINIKTVELLIQAGSNWNIIDTYGYDFLYYLDNNNSSYYNYKDHIIKKYPNEYNKYLIEKEANKYNI